MMRSFLLFGCNPLSFSECIQLIFVQYTPNIPIFKPGLNTMPISKSNKYNAWMEILQCDWFSMHEFRLQHTIPPFSPGFLSVATFVRNDDFGSQTYDLLRPLICRPSVPCKHLLRHFAINFFIATCRN